MQYEVDEYNLEYIEDEDKYYILFKDSANQDCRIEIDKEIFEVYMNSKKVYEKNRNERRRHLEQFELTEEVLYKRILKPKESVEEVVIKNVETEQLKEALKSLSESQYKRIELHIVNDITIRDLAESEKVRKKQIEKSIKLGMRKLKDFFDT